jgi:DNA-binding IclR family transcriptional regulator
MAVSPIKSAVRVLEVLEFFRQHKSPVSLKHIAERLDYPASSATVLLKNLTALGYLSYDRAARTYFPTLRVAALGDWISHELFGQGEIFELMQDLHAATGETVSIALQNDVYLQHIRVIQSAHPLRFHTEEGSLRPLTQSATGWLLLSTHADTAVEKLIRRANIAIPRSEDRQPLEIMQARIKLARKERTIYAENIPLVGGATVATLLPVKVQGKPVVLGMGGAIDRIRPNKDKYLKLVREFAASMKLRKKAD